MVGHKYIQGLSSKCKLIRLHSLKKLRKQNLTSDMANASLCSLSIHTDNSFSPYTPTLAVYMANKFGLRLAGVMDNYTLKGADEFLQACRILGMTYSTGVEIRAQFELDDIRTANVAVMGIAKRHFSALQKDLALYRDNQGQNITATIKAVNKRFLKHGITIDARRDVFSLVKCGKDKVLLSKYVYFALSKKLLQKYDVQQVYDILYNMNIVLTETEVNLLSDQNLHRVYDLTNVLFAHRDRFYLRKNYKTCAEVVELGHKYGAICSFELEIHSVLENTVENKRRLFALADNVKALNFDGVSFNPNMLCDELRNAFFEQLTKLELLPFNLVAIEFPRQDFIPSYPCENSKELMERANYVVVGSEISQNDTGEGFLSSSLKTPDFEQKVVIFSKIGRGE